MFKRYAAGLSLAVGMILSAAPIHAVADEMKTPGTAPDPAMMQQMMKYMTPNDKHRVLDPLVGKWNCVVKGWMKPGDKAEESTGTAETTWVMGGRFIKQEFKGSWAGQPFEGTGYTGYDILREEYQSVWLDNMATGMMHAAGFYNPKTKTVTTTGQFSCPMTGEKDRWIRSDMKIKSNDFNIYTSYGKTPDGKEFKSMEITYTRVK